MSAATRVLTMLGRRKNGVTVEHFPRGYRLAARIHDLRCAGHAIVTIIDETSAGRIARYVLQNKGEV
jgi:hypothetical protein